jgi:hypothetical protein
MANDNPDSTVLELLQLIERQSEMIATIMDRLTTAQSVIDGQQAICEVPQRTSFYRPRQCVQELQELKPINDWKN